MDKAAIRAKADGLCGYRGEHTYTAASEIRDEVEAALTQAYEQGWNERGEADKKAVFNKYKQGLLGPDEVYKAIQEVDIT